MKQGICRFVLIAAGLLASLASGPAQAQNQVIGGLLGGGTGALVGQSVGGRNGAIIGGALGAEILGLDPYFPLKFMIYFLIVVTVGGSSSITGPFLASLLLGIGDVAGKYYVPKMGPFVIYTIMIVILIWRPNGLFGRTAAR